MSYFISKIKNYFYRIFIGNKILRFGETIDIINGKRVWFISDTHFGHQNIIRWCRPEFRNLKDMHHRIISNWNYVVGHYDRVFCLGDFGDFRLFRKLNGKITLVKGNHDKKQWNKQFVINYRGKKF